MLHARSDGETFGLAIAEFSTHNKPVITSSVHHERHTARFHLDVLGDKGLYYHDTHSLVELLLGFDREAARARGDWNAYKAFEPERVMAVFKKVFLDAPRSAPDGDWLNEHSPGHSNAGSSLRVVGSAGASWTSRAQRVASGWPDVGPPDNIFALRAPGPQLHSFEAAIAVSPRQHGEQAGLYCWADAESWVKLVVEGAGGDGNVMLVFASQSQAVPAVRGKIALPEYAGQLWLKLTLTVSDGEPSVVADWRAADKADWQPMRRGVGWLLPHELEGRAYGSLEQGDPRGEARAVCPLPMGAWRAALVTEQWQGDAAWVAFSKVACS